MPSTDLAPISLAPRVVVFDYADTTASMAGRPWTEWLRTYRAHGRGTSPLDALGEQFARFQLDAPSCDNCGAITVRNGNCYLCHNCGNSMGCS